ncbi:MAG: hypothetical protein NWF04_04545 [Candidatus Bathyarchaeota archaeon]|nr:hypothetical protein [Candidatus Bathyarchaeota archaeon]
MNCQKCGQDVLMPFHCPYCGGQFCSAHRLPENHSCPNIGLAHAQRHETVSDAFSSRQSSYEYSVSFGRPRPVKGRIYFSPKELMHLAIGTVLIIAIGLSFGLGSFLSGEGAVVIFGLSILASLLTISFLLHELAHKITAQRRGIWAEFRVTTWGLIITVISLFSPFKLISPGAVMIAGVSRLDDMGKISIAGPITNIILATLFLTATVIPNLYSWAFAIGALLNSYIAVFNLIPFGILDGFKIYRWNKLAWVTTFAAAIALAIPSYMLYTGL